jgi:hypothetical protein
MCELLKSLPKMVKLAEGAFRNHSHYLDMNTYENIPIQFTEYQINRIRKIQENPAIKQAEINRKLEIQRIREQARRQFEERQKEAIRRITGKGKKKNI